MSLIKIDEEVCVKCGVCVNTCRKGVIGRDSTQDTPAVIKPQHCYLCGHCVAACPPGALTHNKLEDVAFTEKTGPINSDALTDIIAGRRSIRRYDDKDLTREEIEAILQAGINAPQAKNSRRQGFAVMQGRARIREMDRAVITGYRRLLKILSAPVLGIIRLVKPSLYKELKRNIPSLRALVSNSDDGGYPIFHDAPCVIVIHGPKANMLARDDAAMAVQNMLLQAFAMGLGGCAIGYAAVKSKPLLQYVPIPEGHAIQTVTVFGHPLSSFRRGINHPLKNITWHD